MLLRSSWCYTLLLHIDRIVGNGGFVSSCISQSSYVLIKSQILTEHHWKQNVACAWHLLSFLKASAAVKPVNRLQSMQEASYPVSVPSACCGGFEVSFIHASNMEGMETLVFWSLGHRFGLGRNILTTIGCIFPQAPKATGCIGSFMVP